MITKHLFLLVASFLALPLVSAAPKFVEGPSRFLMLAGGAAEFTAEHQAVTIVRGPGEGRKLMIYAHGGAGLTRADEDRVAIFRKLPFDVVYFDAFRMNELDSRWANRSLSDTAKQDLIGKILTGAIEHFQKLGYTSIVLYGQSNGARVVINAPAQLANQSSIKLILAEAPSNYGHPLPEKLGVPTKLFVGLKDNWAGRSEDDLMWLRTNPISGRSLKDWIGAQQSQSSPVTVELYQGAGHSFHFGPLTPIKRKLRGFDTVGYLGAPPEVTQKYEHDIVMAARALD
jgi:dienelactone hydrolase